MLERGAAAKYAISVFHEHYNDFDIYVEDTAEGYEKIFARLLSRVMSSRITIERVFPLGGRINVLEEARKNELATNKKRKSVYILDGDLYLLCGEIEEIPSNTIVLPRYCIENFLIDEHALLSIMDEESVNYDIDKISELFDYQGWINRSIECLKELFICFALAHKLRSGIQTVSRGFSSICLNQYGDIDEAKVRLICNEISSELCSRFGEEIVKKSKDEIVANIDNDQCFVTKYVSAKDFSLPLLLIRIRAITRTKAPNINLKMRFSGGCNVESLQSVASAINKIIGTNDSLSQEGSVMAVQ